MLEKNRKYYHVEKEKEVTFFDYVFYNGTQEHSFTFDYGKEVIKDNLLDMFLLKIKDINVVKPNEIKPNTMSKGKQNYKEMQEILLKTLRALDENKIDVERAKSISNVAQTIINSVKTELAINEGKFLE
jgi:hypothetical protein